jgi:hypothetical protein
MKEVFPNSTYIIDNMEFSFNHRTRNKTLHPTHRRKSSKTRGGLSLKPKFGKNTLRAHFGVWCLAHAQGTNTHNKKEKPQTIVSI